MISDEGLPEYKLLRFSSIGAIASPQEVEAMARELLALRKAREGGKLVPDGWKLVPVEPTKEMLDAYDPAPQAIEDEWAAMLAAAPSPTDSL